MEQYFRIGKIYLILFCVSASISFANTTGEWKQIVTAPDDYLIDISLISDSEVFAGGFSLVMGQGGFPLLSPKIYHVKVDGGGHFAKDITGILANKKMVTVSTMEFIDSLKGFIVVGNMLYVTDNMGSSWMQRTPPFSANDIHFFDAYRGIIIGDKGGIAKTSDGGMSWQTIKSPTKISLRCMFWLDENRGFAAGNDYTESEEEGKKPTEGIVIFTPDGGETWYSGYQSQGLSLCPIFFLSDGISGWLAGAGQQGTQPGPAYLLRTNDGGMTFYDMKVQMDVGKVSMMGMTMPLITSYISAMYWSDKNFGHFSGGVHLYDKSQAGGSPKPVYDIVDFITRDGGISWQKTELGVIKIEMAEENTGRGQVFGGAFTSIWNGWMCGEKGLWRYEFACKSNNDCGVGYVCGSNSKCMIEVENLDDLSSDAYLDADVKPKQEDQGTQKLDNGDLAIEKQGKGCSFGTMDYNIFPLLLCCLCLIFRYRTKL